MSNQTVVVTYAGPAPYLATPTWKQVQATLFQQLPLRNIHWKSPARASIRTIQELGVSLVPLESIRDDVTSQLPMTILERPLLNVYIVNCEVSA